MTDSQPQLPYLGDWDKLPRDILEQAASALDDQCVALRTENERLAKNADRNASGYGLLLQYLNLYSMSENCAHKRPCWDWTDELWEREPCEACDWYQRAELLTGKAVDRDVI